MPHMLDTSAFALVISSASPGEPST